MDDKDTVPIEPLEQLALLGALESNIIISSAGFAHHLDTSPQTTFRKLQLLEQGNMITRRLKNMTPILQTLVRLNSLDHCNLWAIHVPERGGVAGPLMHEFSHLPFYDLKTYASDPKH
ncbi:MAG: hypothetical protein U9Q68_06700 [Euryarchaeota archaeon]|nr:hypothetical protein [Euryarchaeota archaeon]